MTIHPLLRIVLTRPELLADHAAAYGALIENEAGKVAGSWAAKIALYAGAAIMALFAVLFTGIALMLRGTVPSETYPAGWALWAVPLACLLLAVGLGLMAKSKPIEQALAVVKAQLHSDLALLQEASEK